MTKEALKLALEALEVCEQSNYGRNWVWPDTAHPTAMANVKEAITAIKEALEQPEQEPVDYEYNPHTPEDTIKYLQGRMTELRKIESRYVRIKNLARQGRLMVANRDGFTLVEDLDEYLTNLTSMEAKRGARR